MLLYYVGPYFTMTIYLYSAGVGLKKEDGFMRGKTRQMGERWRDPRANVFGAWVEMSIPWEVGVRVGGEGNRDPTVLIVRVLEARKRLMGEFGTFSYLASSRNFGVLAPIRGPAFPTGTAMSAKFELPQGHGNAYAGLTCLTLSTIWQ